MPGCTAFCSVLHPVFSLVVFSPLSCSRRCSALKTLFYPSHTANSFAHRHFICIPPPHCLDLDLHCFATCTRSHSALGLERMHLQHDRITNALHTRHCALAMTYNKTASHLHCAHDTVHLYSPRPTRQHVFSTSGTVVPSTTNGEHHHRFCMFVHDGTFHPVL